MLVRSQYITSEMLIAVNKRRQQQVGEVSGEETPSPCCIYYITGTSIPLSVNESPEKHGGNESRCIEGLTQEENGIGVSSVTISGT